MPDYVLLLVKVDGLLSEAKLAYSVLTVIIFLCFLALAFAFALALAVGLFD